jgi:lipoprotein-anchoring transpeptidase ErfK/SrfK
MKQSAEVRIHISVAPQRLSLKAGRKTLRAFSISTSKFGIGTQEGSYKTPLGRFRVAKKIGAGQPADIAFKARIPVAATSEMLASDDLVMSRILWLDGLDPENANTFERYIYIHGTNHEDEIGRPASHGCIRMRKADVTELFDLVPLNTAVVIAEGRAANGPPRKSQKIVARGRRPA